MDSSRLAKSPDHIPTLDGWRAVAILAVLACHSAKEVRAPGGWLGRVLDHGTLGVDIFFGISGYLITTRLLRSMDRDGRINLGKFYLRRVFRILPASWAYLGTILALVTAGVLFVPLKEIYSAALILRNYLPVGANHDKYWYVSHFWSLNIEEHFYLVWPLLLILAGRRRLLWLAPLIALLSGLWRIACVRFPSIDPFPGTLVGFRTDTRLDGLLWGCWLAIVSSDPVARERLSRWLAPVNWTILAVASAVLAAWAPPFHGMLLAFVIPFILLGTILYPQALASRLLELAPMRWIGHISYSLYLWHMLFVVARQENRSPLFGPLQHWPWNIAAAFASAAVSYCVIERPLTRLGHHLTRNASTTASPIPTKHSDNVSGVERIERK